MLQTVDEQDFILVDSWQKLAGEFGSPFLYWDGFEVDELFRGEDRPPCILVTGCYDAGPTYQHEHFPNADLRKHVAVIDWEGAARDHSIYHKVKLGPCLREGRCFPQDRFSLKTDRWTWGTYPEVPKWVREWWTVNLNVAEPGHVPLPFGLNTDGPGWTYVKEFQGRVKDSLLYLNFQNNSVGRLHLKQFWQNQAHCTFRPNPDAPVRQYLEELSRHKFALAPAGNGLDQYRVWECIYLGVIPILEDSHWARHMADTGLPVLVLNTLFGLTEAFLNEQYERILGRNWDYAWAKLSFWRGVFAEAAGRG